MQRRTINPFITHSNETRQIVGEEVGKRYLFGESRGSSFIILELICEGLCFDIQLGQLLVGVGPTSFGILQAKLELSSLKRKWVRLRNDEECCS